MVIIVRDKNLIEMKKCPQTITIHREMWGRKFPLSNFVYSDIETSRLLFKQGWEDTEMNKEKILERIKLLL